MLPSERSAIILLEQGLRPALPGLLTNLAQRAGLIMLGLGVAGVRPSRVVWGSIMAALVVEFGVIDYVRRERFPVQAMLVAPEES